MSVNNPNGTRICRQLTVLQCILKTQEKFTLLIPTYSGPKCDSSNLRSPTFPSCSWKGDQCYLICEIENVSRLRDSFVTAWCRWCKPQNIISYTRLHSTHTLPQTGNLSTTSLQHS